MKIALIFGPYSVYNRPLNFNDIWSNKRGLSGSDLGVVISAKKLAERGHDVSLFTFYENVKPESWEGVKLYDYQDLPKVVDHTFDAAISWNEPDVFRLISRNVLSICQQMLNDFVYCQPDFEQLVDIWTSPSDMHKEWMLKHLPNGNWVTNSLGTDLNWFESEEKNPGSVAWLSSPDRGLHLLLQEWPKIRKAVPNANLKIFYHINDLTEGEPGNRIRYVKNAISKLKNFGVEYVGSSSREEIASHLSKTKVMVAPLSTILPTEGFSVSTIEAMAAGCVPVIGNIDCLGSIYGTVGCMVDSPVEEHTDQLVKFVVKGLTDENWSKEVVDRCQKFSEEYTWDKHVQKLESLIVEAKQLQNVG